MFLFFFAAFSISISPSVVCCGELLKAVAADESSMGELIKPFLESGRQGKLLHLLTHPCCQTGHALGRAEAEVEGAYLEPADSVSLLLSGK